MSKILLIHASCDGQTEAIAERIADRVTRLGHHVTVRPFDAPQTWREAGTADAIIVGGPIRVGRFPKGLEAFVGRRRNAIARVPNAFYSVSLSAANAEEPARRCMQKFGNATGWIPDDSAVFAGALRYTRYSPALRFVMKLISRANGGATDTSRDHEYTDWAAVDRFAAAFALRLRKAA
jgi:menaquinone-dependent protoporphyrinogen oxidase